MIEERDLGGLCRLCIEMSREILVVCADCA